MASKINADEFVDREGEGKPTLPKGVVLSGVTTITTAVVAENEVANSTGINAGIITSTHFKGNLTGDVNAGIVTVSSQTVVGSAVTISASGIDIGAGVITATSYAGSGANLTGLGATIMVWDYNPDPSDMAVTIASGIGITFNQKIKAGSGNITLRKDSSSGDLVENFGIGSSVTIAGNSLSMTPTSSLSENQVFHLSYPSGVITNMAGETYVGTAYTFKTFGYDYQLWTWGYNAHGQLGQNSPTYYSSPVQIPGTTWRRAGSRMGQAYSSWATKTDGTLWSWGYNQQGQLGQNNQTQYSSPNQIPGTTWTDEVNLGNTTNYAGVATKTDGTLWAWGANFRGTLGQNQAPAQLFGASSPTQIPGTTWNTAIDTMGQGINRIQAIKSDGTLWYWGYGGYGSMGNNITATSYYSSPTQLPGTSTWSNIAVSNYFTTLTRTDNTLWGMGYGGYGTLGHGGTTAVPGVSSPIQIPGTTWATGEGKLSATNSSTIAVKTDGTLWSWGWNVYGELGQNSNLKYSSPVQIPGTTWDQVATFSNYAAIATKTDGTLWTWGIGGLGVLGHSQPTNSHISSPTQIPGTDWSRIGSALYSPFAIKRI